jgi:hypothetical protein
MVPEPWGKWVEQRLNGERILTNIVDNNWLIGEYIIIFA